MARIVVPGVPHHVSHRGNRRGDIFLRPEDRIRYIGLLKEYTEKAGMDIWAYCLMTNHVHLLVTPYTEDSLARGVGLAHRRYAVWLNRHEGWQGHLWANRFFSTPMDESHMWTAVRYIERNPVRAGLVKHAEDYPWSSAKAHALRIKDDLLAEKRPFPGPIPKWSEWLREVEDKEAADNIRNCTRTGRPCGSDGFIDWLETCLKRDLRPSKRGPKKK
jgi:putative transposase